MCSQMASGPPFEPPAARPAAVNDAIEAWSVFEQFFVLSYRSAPGIPVLINDLSIRSGTILGISPDSVLNDSELFERLLHPDDRHRVLIEHWDAAANGEPFVSEYRMVSQDGTILWIYDRAVPVTDASGATTLYGNCLDITPGKTEAHPSGTGEHIRSVVADIPGVVYRCACDPTWTVEFVSDQIEDLVGYPASDFIDNSVRTYDSIVHPEDLAYVTGEVGDALERGASYSLEYRLIHVSGETRWVAEHGRPVLGPDGRRQRTVGVILDITRQKAADKSRESIERQVRDDALHDSLTGLPNRTLFHESVAQAISEAQQSGGELAVLVMDLDRFKEVNDTLGHATGDQVLREVGRRLREALREDDSIARFGSDEFALLVPQARRAQVLEVVRRVRAAIEEPIDLEGLPVNLGVSIGISASPRDGVRPTSVKSSAGEIPAASPSIELCPFWAERLSKVLTNPLTVPSNPRSGAAAIMAPNARRCCRNPSCTSSCNRRSVANSSARTGASPTSCRRERRRGSRSMKQREYRMTESAMIANITGPPLLTMSTSAFIRRPFLLPARAACPVAPPSQTPAHSVPGARDSSECGATGNRVRPGWGWRPSGRARLRPALPRCRWQVCPHCQFRTR